MILWKGFLLGPWKVQPDLGTVEQGEKCHRLEPKQMELLCFLVEHQGAVVTKQQIEDHIWEDTYVTSSGLTRNISLLRKVLGDNTQEPSYILTIPKRGYQLLARVAPLPEREETQKPAKAKPQQAIVAPKSSSGLPSWLVPGIIFFFLGSLATLVYFKLKPEQPVEGPLVHSLAVMPLINRSETDENDFFVDGLTEELIDTLGRIEGVKVLGRTSSYAFRDKNLDTRTLGQMLKVSKIMEGSVRRFGDRFRINVRLVDTSTGFQIWSESYDRVLADAFKTQLEIAEVVSQRLEITVVKDRETLVARRETQPQAYDYYLLGQYWCHKANIRDFQQAINYFEKATNVDPNYARAWSGIARTWLLLGLSGAPHFEQYIPKSWEAAHQALELDHNQDEAHSSLGIVALFRDQNLEEAERCFQRAIAINENNPLNRVWYALFLRSVGRLEEAVAQTRLSLKLDPFNIYLMFYAANTYAFAGDYQQAEDLLEETLELSPSFLPALLTRVVIEERRGNWPAMLAAIESIGAPQAVFTDELALVHAHLGNQAKARRYLKVLLAPEPEVGEVSPFRLALIYLALEQTDAALGWLEKAYEKRDPVFIQEAVSHPGLSTIKQHPRFKALANKTTFIP